MSNIPTGPQKDRHIDMSYHREYYPQHDLLMSDKFIDKFMFLFY